MCVFVFISKAKYRPFSLKGIKRKIVLFKRKLARILTNGIGKNKFEI